MNDKYLRNDCVEIAEPSPFNALPIVLYKPDGSLRPAIDYRGLNAITEKDTYPLPNVEANLAALGRANWFTVLDLLQSATAKSVRLSKLAHPSTRRLPWTIVPRGAWHVLLVCSREGRSLHTLRCTGTRLCHSGLRPLPPAPLPSPLEFVVRTSRLDHPRRRHPNPLYHLGVLHYVVSVRANRARLRVYISLFSLLLSCVRWPYVLCMQCLSYLVPSHLGKGLVATWQRHVALHI